MLECQGYNVGFRGLGLGAGFRVREEYPFFGKHVGGHGYLIRRDLRLYRDYCDFQNLGMLSAEGFRV